MKKGLITNYLKRKSNEEDDESEQKRVVEQQPTSTNKEDLPQGNTNRDTNVESEYKQFIPPANFLFPKTKVGTRTRSCQHQWFTKFQWLHYDKT